MFWRPKVALLSILLAIILQYTPCLWVSNPYEIIMWSFITFPSLYVIIFAFSLFFIYFIKLFFRHKDDNSNTNADR